ncbi:MAG: gamma-glutamyltransferase [bacterium]
MTPPKRSRCRLLTAVLSLFLLFGTAAAAIHAPSPGPSGPEASHGPVRAPHGIVASADTLASRVGRDILRKGGNGVDAAVATGFALAVTYPQAGNIGGGGFMVIRFPDGRATTFDYREKAPLAAHPDMFADEEGAYSSRIHHSSHLAVGVPGSVAGLAKAHSAYGRLSWDEVVAPAVELAREGFPLTRGLASALTSALDDFERYPASLDAFSKDGEPCQAGEVFRQPDLARTLERIQHQGRDGFYRGETARLLVEEMERGGGMITEEDLARYEAVEREPMRGTYRGHEVISMPPPSSGGTAVIEMLNILEGYDLQAMGHNSAAYIHHLTEAMRRAYRDRARFLADTDFVDVPLERLTSKEYAARLRSTIREDRATPSSPADIEQPFESPETTHYSVVDADGMGVSVTTTLESWFGSKITVPGAGFLLNNEMGDFNPRRGLTTERGYIGTEPNLARPEQRMLSSMTPTILAKEGGRVAVVGSPGGRTIINTVLHVILNIVDFEMGIQEAVNASRFHHQWLPDQIRIEERGTTADTVRILEAMGHEIRMRGTQGRAHCIMIDPRTGERLGAADPREVDGAAVGY